MPATVQDSSAFPGNEQSVAVSAFAPTVTVVAVYEIPGHAGIDAADLAVPGENGHEFFRVAHSAKIAKFPVQCPIFLTGLALDKE